MKIHRYISQTIGLNPIAFWGVTDIKCPHCADGYMTIYSVKGNKRYMICTVPNGQLLRLPGCGYYRQVVSVVTE